ncbi:MAG: hypothetical protein ACYDCN_05505 [Bacteroidia bacterium]
MARKLSKKVILTANFRNQTEGAKLRKIGDIAGANTDNPTIVPALDPPAATVSSKVVAVQDLITERDVMKATLQGLTQRVHDEIDELKDIITRQWMPQSEIAIDGDTSKAILLGWGIKGISVGHSAVSAPGVSSTKDGHSAPIILRIERDVPEKHTLHIRNDVTGSVVKPKNILRVDVYAQIGGTKPTELATLLANGGGFLGTATRGKFVSNFPNGKGKEIFYIAVYIDKKTLKPAMESKVADAMVN